MTANTLAQFAKEYSGYAKEPVTLEYIKGTLYVFGSELAVLRLFHKFNSAAHVKDSRAGFSVNLQKWYFSLEVRYERTDENLPQSGCYAHRGTPVSTCNDCIGEIE
jgi:hypothetical protein